MPFFDFVRSCVFLFLCVPFLAWNCVCSASRRVLVSFGSPPLAGRFSCVSDIRGIAESWPRLKQLDWEKMSDDEVRDELIQLRGIGPWTIDMILIFNLMRPDILPLGDIGVVRMIEKLYANKESLSHGEMAEIAEKWQPFRTVATWYLWRDLDPEPVQY